AMSTTKPPTAHVALHSASPLVSMTGFVSEQSSEHGPSPSGVPSWQLTPKSQPAFGHTGGLSTLKSPLPKLPITALFTVTPIFMHCGALFWHSAPLPTRGTIVASIETVVNHGKP